jgi:UDP-glucose 4-epimerase
VSIRDLADRIITITGSSSPLEFISYDMAYEEGFEDMQRRVPSIERAQELVGFSPSLGLDDIIRSVIDDQHR